MTVTASVLADSVSAHSGKRLTTFLLRYPRFIHSEVMTHRRFARNASSSRAIPMMKMIKEINEDPAMPERWGLNGKGMQDHGPLSPDQEAEAKRLWLVARDNAVGVVGKLMAMKEVPHKQISNRLLEPWMHIHVLVTATEYDNFFALRCHEDADPTIKVLADRMWEAYDASEPVELQHGQWHMPFVGIEDRVLIREHLKEKLGAPVAFDVTEAQMTQYLLKLSTARCARTSYTDHYGKRPSVEKDLILHDDLVGKQPVHASPAEHQGTPDTGSYVTVPGSKSEWRWTNPSLHGPFVGFCQYRKTIPGEEIKQYRREKRDG
jgi:hypothetical protein